MHDATDPRARPDPGSWATALASEPDISFIGVNSEGVLRTWPATAERLLGWSEGEMVGRRADLLFAETARGELSARLGPGNGARPRGEWIVDLRGRDGRRVPCGVRIFATEDAGATLLVRERGIDGFTLREVAVRAGVSHAAPYHHFDDRAALVSALSSAPCVFANW